MSLAIKIIGSVLIVSACFLTGYSMARNLSVRRDFLKNLIVFLSSLSTNLRYNSSDIFTLVSLCARDDEMSYFRFDDTLINQPFETMWAEKVSSLPKSLSLKKSDKELLYEFGRELGKTDVDGQLKHIELYKTVFEKQLSSAEEDINKKSKLYKTMGFFVGVSAVLVMI